VSSGVVDGSAVSRGAVAESLALVDVVASGAAGAFGSSELVGEVVSVAVGASAVSSGRIP
jgi:hypothetical protein